MTNEKLTAILAAHLVWLSTSGEDGERADLRGANLEDADLRDADLRDANLEGAFLEGVNFEAANLEAANLRGANLREAGLRGARLERANLQSANLEIANFQGAFLYNADLRDANLDNANLKDANLQGANLDRAFLGGASLRGADLSVASLKEANLEGADLRYADLEEAHLEGANLSANLKNANLRHAILRRASLADARLEGADFAGANLEGANLEGTILEKEFEAHSAVAKGKKTGAISKLKRQSLPMKAGAFKKLFPEEFERIKAETKGADFTPDLLETLVKKYGIVWSVSTGTYHGEAQRVCPSANDVLQLNIDMSDPVYTEQQKKNLEAVKEVSARSSHPVARGKKYFTIGWVRYCQFPDRILVEEVQSDVPGVRKGLKDPDFRRCLERAGVSPDELEETLALLAPFADRFYEDALGLVFDMAEEQGKKVEMLDYAQKEIFGSPRNVYTDLPRSMGMKLGPSEAMPEVGQVWKYTPNRKQRMR